MQYLSVDNKNTGLEKKLLCAGTISGSFMEKVRIEFNLEVTLFISAAFCTGSVKVDFNLKMRIR